ncbi:hypothetical protein SEVCU121_1889 [Staphylococcus warneri VCU121]|nr:hypothetical protein SEVCU121_1889 [Staphylococcus warneri VCU121]
MVSSLAHEGGYLIISLELLFIDYPTCHSLYDIYQLNRVLFAELKPYAL